MLLAVLVMMLFVSTLADRTATILRSKFENDGLGNYEFWSEQSDGIYRWQMGELRYTSDGKPFIYTTGGYAYDDYEAKVVRVVEFVADENGYQPTISLEGLPPGAPPPRMLKGAAG